jgi:hypothetical protein
MRQVDARDRLARARDDLLGQRARLPLEREDRTVVVGVGGVVDQARPEGLGDRGDGLGVAAFGDVGDGE